MHYITYIIQEVNDSMRKKETKEKFEKGESVSASEHYPLAMLIAWIIAIFSLLKIICTYGPDILKLFS